MSEVKACSTMYIMDMHSRVSGSVEWMNEPMHGWMKDTLPYSTLMLSKIPYSYKTIFSLKAHLHILLYLIIIKLMFIESQLCVRRWTKLFT